MALPIVTAGWLSTFSYVGLCFVAALALGLAARVRGNELVLTVLACASAAAVTPAAATAGS